jgi:hypothetical protein
MPHHWHGSEMSSIPDCVAQTGPTLEASFARTTYTNSIGALFPTPKVLWVDDACAGHLNDDCH